jgi:glycerophosphoryl diester phosphodiesterase
MRAGFVRRPLEKTLFLVLCWGLVAVAEAGEPMLIAHRGLARHAPENTLPAFAACVELGIGFELDLYSSRDDQLVVIHNPNLDSTTDGPHRSVREFTVAELKRLDAGSRFHASFKGVGIPTFEEVLAVVDQRRRGPTMLALNVKQITPAGERQLVALVAKHGLLGQSFAFDQDDACSRRLKSHNPAFRIGQNVGRQDLARRLAQNDLDVFLLTALPTPEEIALLHKQQKTAVFNFSGPGPARRNPDTWERIKQVGVDGLLTDFPLECRRHWRGAE